MYPIFNTRKRTSSGYLSEDNTLYATSNKYVAATDRQTRPSLINNRFPGMSYTPKLQPMNFQPQNKFPNAVPQLRYQYQQPSTSNQTRPLLNTQVNSLQQRQEQFARLPGHGIQTPPKPSVVNKPNQRKSKSGDISDTSFLTVTIDKMRYWSKYKEQIPHIFETFGLVDSAVVRSRDGTKETFQLKDQSSTITCCFYNMDREMPKIHEGQWIRCVGVLNAIGEMHCISVRPATIEEQQFFLVLVGVCTRAMHIKIGKLNDNNL